MTNFSPRTFEQIQSEFFGALISSNSTLSDTSPGSGIHALSRAVAITHLEQELLLDTTSSSYYLSTAKGQELEALASDFGLTRKLGSPASGYVLVTSSREELPIQPGAIFTDPRTQLQLRVASSSVTSVSFLVETKIPVVSTTTGYQTNLTEGTELIYSSDLRIDAVVGSHRTSAGQVCGSLSGGADEESDLEFRIRISEYIVNRRGTTKNAIRNLLLSDPAVSWVHLESPIPGLIQVWIDNPLIISPSELQRLKDIAEKAKPAGCVLSVQQPFREPVDIEVKVRINRNADQDFISASIASVIRTYVYGIQMAGSFSREDLIAEISRIQNILSVELIKPLSDFTAGQDSVIRIRDFVVSYELL